MTAALKIFCIIAISTISQAVEPLNVIGEGLMSSPMAPGKGVRYAGPIVYTDEKPPIIYFPPPPKNAKPGFGGPFGKSKSPKSIKYVPMPHHDLPVLIYTSDKAPPIHVVQPPGDSSQINSGPHFSSSINSGPPFGSPSSSGPQFSSSINSGPPFGSSSSSGPHFSSLINSGPLFNPSISSGPPFGSFSSSSSFGPPNDFYSGPGPFQGPGFNSPIGRPGSLSSTYRLPEATSARIVTSSYEIPSTSYGTPLKAFGSPHGSLDLSQGSSSVAVEESSSIQQPVVSEPYRSVQPPVSEPMFNSPQYQSFGPALSSPQKKHPHIVYTGHPPIHFFNQPDTFVRAPKQIPLKTFDDMPPKASFGPPKNYFGPPAINSFGSPVSPYRPSMASFGPPAPAYRPSSFQIIPARENLVTSASTYKPTSVMSFGPPMPSYGSQKVESESPVVSQSSYGGGSLFKSYGPPSYSFAPSQSQYSLGPFSVEYGPPVDAFNEPFMSFSEPQGSLTSLYGAMSENGGNEWMPGPPPAPASNNAGGAFKENAWHQPPSGHGPMPGPNSHQSSIFLPSSPFGGSSKLANLFSSFKLKRSKPKYAIAPKSMHKPPIIIYYGKQPPVHVYKKPEEEVSAASSISTSVSSEPPSGSVSINTQEQVQSSSADNVDLTYGASQNSEVRVAPSAPELKPTITAAKTATISRKPAIIPAKPVDIFPSTELQPSVYMARNSLNTIFVSDLSGSGATAIKTYIVRSEEPERMGSSKPSVAQSPVIAPTEEEQFVDISHISNAGSIPIAEDRISASQTQSTGSMSENIESIGDSAISPTVLLTAAVSTQPEEIVIQQQPEIHEQPSILLRSPSSFQTSLSQAEKEADFLS